MVLDDDIVEDTEKIIIYKPQETNITVINNYDDHDDGHFMRRIYNGNILSISGKLKHNRSFNIDIETTPTDNCAVLNFKVTKAEPHWIIHDVEYMCSECRNKFNTGTNYCSYCGTRIKRCEVDLIGGD